MGHGGFCLRFEGPSQAEECSRRIRVVIRAWQKECEKPDGADGGTPEEYSWVHDLRVTDEFVYVSGKSELPAGLYGLELAEKGDALFQRICRAIAEEAIGSFEGRCAYESDEGVLQAIEVDFDGLQLVFTVLGAHAGELCARCAEDPGDPWEPWLADQEREAVGNNLLALMRPAFTCEHEGCSITVNVQHWEADAEWPFGGRMPFVRVEPDETYGLDQALMSRAQTLDPEACSKVAVRWLEQHADDEEVMARLANDPTLGRDPKLMTCYVWSERAWMHVAKVVPRLDTVALSRLRGYVMFTNKDEVVGMARKENTPVAYASVVRMLRLTKNDVPHDLVQGLLDSLCGRDPSPTEWSAVLDMYEPDRTEVVLALLDVDGGTEYARARGLIDAVCNGSRHRELDREALREGAHTELQSRNLRFFESYFRGIHCTWR